MGLPHLFFELLSQISAQADVYHGGPHKVSVRMVGREKKNRDRTCNHLLQFGRVFKAASLLQFRDHTAFRFIGCR
jgi:hypothetical protein